MSKALKGLNVLSKHDPDMFNKILGHKEYKIVIEKADGDAEKLKNIFWNDLADDYHWEFIKGEIVLRSGKSVMAATVKQNLQMLLWGFLKKNKTGEVFGARCVCNFDDNFFSPDIFYYESRNAKLFYAEMNSFPIPDFIIEFNDENTEANNRGVKFEEYKRKGVKEYWMVNTESKTVEQYLLTKGIFDFMGFTKSGKLKSFVVNEFECSLEDIFEM